MNTETDGVAGKSDPEIQALAALHDAISPLDESQRERVLRWAWRRYVADAYAERMLARGTPESPFRDMKLGKL